MQINQSTVDKPSRVVHAGDDVTVDGDSDVGRGAAKLRGALRDLPTDLAGKTAIDVGASTGGFTQVLLEAGVRHVFAIDVGTHQLSERLLGDPRIVNMPGTHIRDVSASQLLQQAPTGSLPDVLVADVSFISLTDIIPALATLFTGTGFLLVKPQFETQRAHLNKQGVVKSPEIAVQGAMRVAQSVWDADMQITGVAPCRVVGKTGNREWFFRITPSTPGLSEASVERAVTDSDVVWHHQESAD